MKLQNAYISEKGDEVGNWYLIGYNGPGEWTSAASTNTNTKGAATKSTNFTYTDGLAPQALSSLTEATTALTIANINKLNDCAAGNNWTVAISAGAEGTAAGEAVYKSTVAGTGCTALTPNFEAIK